jgi:hypothetical protein
MADRFDPRQYRLPHDGSSVIRPPEQLILPSRPLPDKPYGWSSSSAPKDDSYLNALSQAIKNKTKDPFPKAAASPIKASKKSNTISESKLSNSIKNIQPKNNKSGYSFSKDDDDDDYPPKPPNSGGAVVKPKPSPKSPSGGAARRIDPMDRREKVRSY